MNLKTAFARFKYLFYLGLFLPLIGLSLLARYLPLQAFLVISGGMLLLLGYLLYLKFSVTQQKASHTLQTQDLREQINLLTASIQQDNTAISSFHQKIRNYALLKKLTEELSLSLTLEDTISTLTQEVNKLLGDKGTTLILYLFHSQTGELGIKSSQKGEMRVNIKSKKGDEFDQFLVKTMQPLLVEDAKRDYRFDIEKVKIEDERTVRSLMSVPLMVGSKALGILRMDSPLANRFSTEALRFLTMIGDLGAIAIENAQLYERVQQLAIKDSLTGLYLRRYLDDRLREEVSRELRGQKPLSLLMLDIDHFKDYNDRFGHIAGDIVLKTVGKMLSAKFKKPGQLCSRYGGEEFAVVLPDCSKDEASRTAEELRRNIAREDIVLRRQKSNITVSIGVATLPQDGHEKESLVRRADEALYRAKKEGRNRVCGA